MERLYQTIFKNYLENFRQMLFVMGPRQSGKTTVAQTLARQHVRGFYLNWDNINDREQILYGPKYIAEQLKLEVLSVNKPMVVFDELHKYKHWRDFLKGFYDSYPNE